MNPLKWPMHFQIFSLVLMVFAAGQGIGFYLFADERSSAIRAAVGAEAAGRAANVAALLENAPLELQTSIIQAATSPLVQFDLSDYPMVTDGEHHDDPAVEARIRALMNDSYSRDIRIEVHQVEAGVLPLPNLSPEMADLHADMMRGTLSATELDISIALQGGRWLNVSTKFERPPWQITYGQIVTFFLSIGLVLAAVFWFVTARLTRPLRALRQAADEFGRGHNTTDVPAEGPPEVRSLSQSFATMQDRISRFVTDRTMMLAAMAHDLRSPMTALRVHADMVEDEGLRSSMVKSTDDMSQMLDATLAYARGVGRDENPIECAISDLMDVSLTGDDQLVTVRPQSMKRAFANIIQNAERYAGSVSISCGQSENGVAILFDDTGPGIPNDKLEQVFDPYVRIEESRSQETGGYGLGLSIAKSIILSHGGKIALENRNGGGLRVRVWLPS